MEKVQPSFSPRDKVIRAAEPDGPRGYVLEVDDERGVARVSFAGLSPMWIRTSTLAHAKAEQPAAPVLVELDGRKPEVKAEPVDVLDLVRQYGHEGYESGVAAAQRDEDADDYHDGKARRLYAQIEAEIQRLREPRYTGQVLLEYGTLPVGSLMHTEVIYSDHRDFEWLLVEDVNACTRRDCAVAAGVADACVVTTVRGQGMRHRRRDWPVYARIPATTAVQA